MTTEPLGKSHRMRGPACPSCQRSTPTATGVETDERPKPGDLSVCVYCAVVTRYGLGCLVLEIVPPEEFLALPEATRVSVARLQAAVLLARARERSNT